MYVHDVGRLDETRQATVIAYGMVWFVFSSLLAGWRRRVSGLNKAGICLDRRFPDEVVYCVKSGGLLN